MTALEQLRPAADRDEVDPGVRDAFAPQADAALKYLKSIAREGHDVLRGQALGKLREPQQPSPADTWSFHDPDLDRKSLRLSDPIRREIFCSVLDEMKLRLGERRTWLYGRLIANAVDGIRVCEEQGWPSDPMLRWLAFDLCDLPNAKLPLHSARPGRTLEILEREHRLLCLVDTRYEGRIEYLEAVRDVVLARYQKNVRGGKQGDYKFRPQKFVAEGVRSYLRQEAARQYTRIVIESFSPFRPGGKKPERLTYQDGDVAGTIEIVAPVDTDWGLAREVEAIRPKPSKRAPAKGRCQCEFVDEYDEYPVADSHAARSLNSLGGPLIPLGWRMSPDQAWATGAARQYDGRSIYRIAFPHPANIEHRDPFLHRVPPQSQMAIPAAEHDRMEGRLQPKTNLWESDAMRGDSAAQSAQDSRKVWFQCKICGRPYRASIEARILEPRCLYCFRCKGYQEVQDIWRPERVLIVNRSRLMTEHAWVCTKCGTALLARDSDPALGRNWHARTWIALMPPKSFRQSEAPRPTFEQWMEGMDPEFASNLRAMYEAAKQGVRPTWAIAAKKVALGIDSRDLKNYSTRLKRKHAKDWARIEELRPRALPYFDEQGRRTNGLCLGDKTLYERIAQARGASWRQTARNLRESVDDTGNEIVGWRGESELADGTPDPVVENNGSTSLNQRAQINTDKWDRFITETVERIFGRRRARTPLDRLSESRFFDLKKGLTEVRLDLLPAGWKDEHPSAPCWAAMQDTPNPFPSRTRVHHPIFGHTSRPEGQGTRCGERERNSSSAPGDSFGKEIGVKTLDLGIAKSLLTLTK